MVVLILRKKKIIAIIGILAVALIGLLAPYKLGADGVSYSVLDCIMNRGGVERGEVYSAFHTGTSFFWFCILAPLIVSVPVLAYISDVEISGFNKAEKIRTGRMKYNFRRLGWMLGGCAILLFLGLLLYMIALSSALPLSFSADYLKKYLYILGCSFVASVFAADLLFVYNDLFFVMSIAFAVLYIFRNWLFYSNVCVIMILAVTLSFIFLLLGRWDRI